MSRTSHTLRRRPARVLPAVLVSLLVLVLVALSIWAIVARFTEGEWPEPVRSGAMAVMQTPLSAPGVLTAAILAGLLGLVLLLCAVIPGRHSASALHIDQARYDGPQQTVLTHRGLARLLEARTGRVDGVAAVRCTARSRRVDLECDTPLHHGAEVRQRVQAVAGDFVDRLPLHQRPKVTVTVREDRTR